MFRFSKLSQGFLRKNIKNLCTKKENDSEVAKAIRERNKLYEDTIKGISHGVIFGSSIVIGVTSYLMYKDKNK